MSCPVCEAQRPGAWPRCPEDGAKLDFRFCLLWVCPEPECGYVEDAEPLAAEFKYWHDEMGMSEDGALACLKLVEDWADAR